MGNNNSNGGGGGDGGGDEEVTYDNLYEGSGEKSGKETISITNNPRVVSSSNLASSLLSSPSSSLSAAAASSPSSSTSSISKDGDYLYEICRGSTSGSGLPSSSPSPPSRFVGDMIKKGHIIPSRKNRHFVLDAGYLRYYVGPREDAPFGLGLKGGFCLLGYSIYNIVGNIEIGVDIENIDNDENVNENCHFQLIKKEASQSVIPTGFDLLVDSKNTGAAYSLEASSIYAKRRWIKNIREHINYIGSMQHKSANATYLPALNQFWFSIHAKYSSFLSERELILKCGVVTKPNKIAFSEEKCILLLTTKQRLIHIDYDKFEIGGVIYLDPSNVKKNSTSLEIIDSVSFSVSTTSRSVPWRFNILQSDDGLMHLGYGPSGTLLALLPSENDLKKSSASPSKRQTSLEPRQSVIKSTSRLTGIPNAEDWIQAIQDCITFPV